MRPFLPFLSGLLLLAAFLCTPEQTRAQERLPYTVQQIEDLLASRLSQSVILAMVRTDCIGFIVDDEAAGRLTAAGANAEFIAGLRGVCYRSPEPEVPEAPSPELLSPSSAAVRSLVVPGLGQFYTGRPAVGALFLAGWAGAITAGVMNKKVTEECLARTTGACPSDQIRGEVVERPMLLVGLGAAAVVAVVSALEARSGANKANARQLALDRGARGRDLVLEVLPQPKAATGRRLVLLQLRYR